jgi:hypothetical protein
MRARVRKIQCSVRGCKNKASYDSPKVWCTKHWRKWWNWPREKPEPKWMAPARVSHA